MILLIKRIDKTYGGYDYIEIDENNNRYKTGNSRSHFGHYEGKKLEINVTTKKELKEIALQCDYNIEMVNDTHNFNVRQINKTVENNNI